MNKEYACPVCAASMKGECRLCGYKEKNCVQRINSKERQKFAGTSLSFLLCQTKPYERRHKQDKDKNGKKTE